MISIWLVLNWKQLCLNWLLETVLKKSFNKEIEDKFAGTLGSASINVKGKYANTAAIGDATTAIGTLSEAYGTGSTAIGINSLTKRCSQHRHRYHDT